MVINRTGRQERRATGKKVEIIISVKTVLERSARPQKMVAFEPGPAVRWAGWACWRFMKRWKFEKSSFFILGTKGLGREGRSALFPPPVITQTVGGTNIKNLGFLVPCELLSYTFQRGQIKQVIRFRLTALSPSNQGKQRSCLDPCELCKSEVADHSSFQTPSYRRCTHGWNSYRGSQHGSSFEVFSPRVFHGCCKTSILWRPSPATRVTSEKSGRCLKDLKDWRTLLWNSVEAEEMQPSLNEYVMYLFSSWKALLSSFSIAMHCQTILD